MQQNIIFKNIDGKVTVIADFNISFDVFIDSLKNRLDMLYIKDDLLKSNLTLDIRNIELDAKKILSIFDVLASYESIYINKVIYKEKTNKNIILHEGNIRGGEIRLFPNNTLLIGNINKGAKVIVNGNLYIIGKVNGTLEFKGITNKLMASNVEDCYIKICSFEKKIEGLKENITVMINDNSIVEEKFMDRREREYGKSNCSYIW
jgi:hypothetical protein